jgi:hypothetical protein
MSKGVTFTLIGSKRACGSLALLATSSLMRSRKRKGAVHSFLIEESAPGVVRVAKASAKARGWPLVVRV